MDRYLLIRVQVPVDGDIRFPGMMRFDESTLTSSTVDFDFELDVSMYPKTKARSRVVAHVEVDDR